MINWLALKAEFLQTDPNVGLREFFKSKKVVPDGKSYHKANGMKFIEDRDAIYRNIPQKTAETVNSQVGDLAERWHKHIKILEDVENKARGLLEKGILIRSLTGTEIAKRPLNTRELADVVTIIKQSVEVQRLLLGQSTANVGIQGLHTLIVSVDEAMRKGNIPGGADEPAPVP